MPHPPPTYSESVSESISLPPNEYKCDTSSTGPTMILRTCIQACTSGTIGLRLVVPCATHFLARDGIKELTAHVTSATPPPFCNHVCRYEVACTDMWENEIIWADLPPSLPVACAGAATLYLLYKRAHNLSDAYIQIPQHSNFSPLRLHVWDTPTKTHPHYPHCTGPCWPRSI